MRVLLLLVLAAAVINVPFAVTRIRSRTGAKPLNSLRFSGANTPKTWPASTPHKEPWSAPTNWEEWRAFGYREYHVTSGGPRFTMQVQFLGWPLGVVEHKQMWWNWDDPTLEGPEPNPAPTLRPLGLVVNPLLVGGVAFACLFGPRIAFVVVRRVLRLSRRQCANCGYAIRTKSPICPECGAKLRRPDGVSEAEAARRGH